MERDIIREISESKNRDIVIHMDSEKHWSEYIVFLNSRIHTLIDLKKLFFFIPAP